MQIESVRSKPTPSNSPSSPQVNEREACTESIFIDGKIVPIDAGRLIRIAGFLKDRNECTLSIKDGLSFVLRRLDTIFTLREETCGLARQHATEHLGAGLSVTINSHGKVQGTHNYVRVDFILGTATSPAQQERTFLPCHDALL